MEVLDVRCAAAIPCGYVLNLDDNAINVFTDGSMKERPRRGGVGYRFVTTGVDGREETWDSDLPGYMGATNNEMELQAVILALGHLTGRRPPVDVARFNKIIMLTDSQYVQKNLPAARRWAANGWRKGSGAPVLNAERWKELLALERRSQLRVTFQWVKGKSSEHTKAVDELAKASAERPTARPLSHPAPARKLTAKSVKHGSVPVAGQVVDIRIVTEEYLRLPRCWRYKYELIAGDLAGEIDVATSDLVLRRNGAYRLRLNDDPANPQFVEKIAELALDS